MTRTIEISHKGCSSRFALVPIDRKRLHGFKRRIALDENGEECASAHLTRDGRFLLSAGCTAALYVNEDGDTVNRNDLAAIDMEGKPLPTLPATTGRSQAIEGLIALDDFLGHVVTRVYALEAETLDQAFDSALRAGAIFRTSFRPRPTYTETPAFLLTNEHGIFLVQAEPCNFDFVGMEQTVSDVDALDERDADFSEEDEFAFDLEWEADHAVA